MHYQKNLIIKKELKILLKFLGEFNNWYKWIIDDHKNLAEKFITIKYKKISKILLIAIKFYKFNFIEFTDL